MTRASTVAPSRFPVWAGAGYTVVVASLVFGFRTARERTLADLGTAEAAQQWQAWRAETARQSKSPGPVARREQRAVEPPLLILMRDHFAAALGTTLLAVTIFYWFLAFILRGILRGSAPATAGEVAKERSP